MAATHFSGPVVSSNGFTGALTGAVVATTVTASTSAAIGGGTALTKVVRGTIAVDPASMLTLTASVKTLTITGAVVGDTVVITPGAAGFTAGILIGAAYVSAADTVKVDLFNATAGTVDNASLTCDYTLIRS
jgi:hypothetical protein